MGKKRLPRFGINEMRGCLQSISSSDSQAIFDELSLDVELAYAEGAIGDEATSERSRKGPEDGGLRFCRYSLMLIRKTPDPLQVRFEIWKSHSLDCNSHRLHILPIMNINQRLPRLSWDCLLTPHSNPSFPPCP